MSEQGEERSAEALQLSIGSERAIELAEAEFWKELDHHQRAEWQMSIVELAMPFDVFHEALESALGRPVFTHELGLNFVGVYDELFNGKSAPSLTEVLEMIPPDKRIVISMPAEGEES